MITHTSSSDNAERKLAVQWSSRQVMYEKISHMIPSCSVRWISPNLIGSFSVQFIVNAPKAQQISSQLLDQRLNFAFEPGEYARALPNVGTKQLYLQQLKETNEAAYIRYEWPNGFAEYALLVKPMRLPDDKWIYGVCAHAGQPVRLLLQLPLIGSKRPEIQTRHPPYTLTLEKLRSLAPGQPTRYVEPLKRAYDVRFPLWKQADWNVLTNHEGMIIAAVRPYGDQWRRTIYQYGTRALMGHPPAHWPTVLSVLQGKTVLSLHTHLDLDEVIEQERRTPQPAGIGRLYSSCYTGLSSFVLAEEEGFIFCFVVDDEPLEVPISDEHLSLADWIGPGAAVLTPTQVEAREILRRRQLSKKAQADLPTVETLASLSHQGASESISKRFARVIVDHIEGRYAVG